MQTAMHTAQDRNQTPAALLDAGGFLQKLSPAALDDLTSIRTPNQL